MVQCQRLDSIVDGLGMHHVDFVKIDTEGWEGPVLESMGDLLEPQSVGSILLEASPEFGDLGYLDELVRRGFSVHTLSRVGNSAPNSRPPLANILLQRCERAMRCRGSESVPLGTSRRDLVSTMNPRRHPTPPRQGHHD